MPRFPWIAALAAAALCASSAHAVKPRTEPLASNRAGANGAGEILIGGKRISRLKPRPVPMTPAQQKAMNEFYAASLALPPGLGLTNWRSADWARKAIDQAPATSSKPFGKMAVFMPGLGGWGPGAAFVFRMAKYTDRVVLAYQGTSKAAANGLRVAQKVAGVPVPEELKGRILMMGDGDNRAIVTPAQGADLMIEYFSLMVRKKDLLGFDPLTSKSTVFGHSEGSFIVALTREKLEKEGFPDAIGKTVIMAGGLGATKDIKWSALPPLQAYRAVVRKLGSPSNLAGVVDEYEAIVGSFGPAKVHLSDLAVVAHIGPPIKVSVGLKGLKVENMNDIRPGMRFLAIGQAAFETFSKPWTNWSDDVIKLLGKHEWDDTDGCVKKDWAAYGKKVLTISKPHDHAGMIEDPAVVDEIAKAL
jgi:hypothetical protein